MGQATGQWSAVQNLPYIPVHVAMLVDGRVLFYSYYADSVHPQIWDLGTGTAVPTAAAPYQLFCSGQNQLPDGRVFITGGHIADYTGYAHSVIYDPNTNAFTTVPDMNAGRWYPTNTVLPNGDVLVVSGDQTSNTSPNPLPQIFQLGTNTWRDLTTAQLQMPLYPVMLVAPNGKVFNAGPSRTTRYLDTSGTGTWSSVGTMQSSVSRTYGPGVMYESGKVLEIGGGDPPMATAEVIDLNSSTPAWRFTSSMHYPRRQHNAVVLPDGKVLAVGGSSGSGFDNSSTPVYPTELWDPATGQWTVMASISKYRGYHSTAFLLPDGRVFSGGGNVGGPNYQLFSPPYLSAGTRPTITSAPTTVGYGQTVSVGTPDAAKISKVSLIRLPSVTHTIDMNGRYMTLAFSAASGELNITIPANANLAPPGHYMLFILDGTGVPSVARIVAVGTGPSTTGTVAGVVTNTAGAPLGGVTVSAGGSTSTTLANGQYTLANLQPGTVTVTASLPQYQDASTSVTVTAGASANAATLQLAPDNPGDVTGSVTNTTGFPLASASVGGAGQTVVTNPSGTYSLSNVPAGPTSLNASAPTYASSSQTVNIVAGTSVTAAVFVLGPDSGTVTGTIKNSSGVALVGATVSYAAGSTKTDSTGKYTFTAVPIGTIKLSASASGYVTKSQDVTVTSGTTSTVNFVLSASTGTGTLTGKVANISTGAAIVGATVKWSGGSTTSNTSGVYNLVNVTAGTQPITASATGYKSRILSVAVISGATTTLNIPLAATGKISVKVTTSSGGVVSGATVTAKGGVISTTVKGTTNTYGIYTTTWIPIGSYSVTVSKTGHTTQTKTATVSTGKTTSVTFSSF